MPKKDLIAVEQGGIIRFNKETPEDIEGFCTYGLKTCIALLLVGYNQNFSLMHLDRQISASSIEDEKNTIGKVKDCKVIVNKRFLLEKGENAQSITEEILKKVEDIMGTFPKKIIDSSTFLINIKREDEGIRLKFDTKKNLQELQERNLYNLEFEKYRKALYYVSRIFSDELPINLEYNGTEFTKLPIIEKKLLRDIELLRELNTSEKIQWLKKEGTAEKYPSLSSFLNPEDSSNDVEKLAKFAKQIEEYFTCQKKSKSTLIEYSVPFVDEEKKQLLTTLTKQFGSDKETRKQRQTNYSMTYKVKLPSSTLTKGVRDKLGIDRVTVGKIRSREEKDLPEAITSSRDISKLSSNQNQVSQSRV